MKVIRFEMPTHFKSVEIVPIADAHLGDPNADERKLRETIDYIAANENVYCILNGDIMNTALKSSVSDVYSEVMTPMEQLVAFVLLFNPIKDKIIAGTSGNHEARILKNDGIDLTRLAFRELGIEDRFSPESAVIFIRVGKQSGNKHHLPVVYAVYMNHGSGGGRKEGSKAIRLADMASIIDCDVYVHSHTHLPMIMKQRFWRTNFNKSSAFPVDKLFVNTGAFLKYGGYGEVQEYKPSSTDTPHIFLDGTKKNASAHL